MPRVPPELAAKVTKQTNAGYRAAVGKRKIKAAAKSVILHSGKWRTPGQQVAAPSALKRSRLTNGQIKAAMAVFASGEL